MGVVNYAAHRRIIERLYEDRCTITRVSEVKMPWGETKFERQRQVIAENVPCRISQKALGTNNQSETINVIAYETKLFIAPDIEIRQGDEIEVTRGSVTRKYTAGEPFVYPSHQEVNLQRRENA